MNPFKRTLWLNGTKQFTVNNLVVENMFLIYSRYILSQNPVDKHGRKGVGRGKIRNHECNKSH